MTPRRAGPLLLLLLAAGWLLLAAHRGGWPPPPPPAPPPPRSAAPRIVHGVFALDGDTFRIEGRTVRLLGADTPERAAPWFDGDQEPWAGRALGFAQGAIARARCVEFLDVGEDARGRALGHLWLDGRPLAALLVEARLAQETVSRFGDGGRPDVARAITAAGHGRRLEFEAPYRWRRQHRKEGHERLEYETQSPVVSGRDTTGTDKKVTSDEDHARSGN